MKNICELLKNQIPRHPGRDGEIADHCLASAVSNAGIWE